MMAICASESAYKCTRMIKVLAWLLAVVVASAALTPEQAVEKGILQIQPSALDSLRHYFDVIVLLVKRNHTDDELPFTQLVARLNTSTQANPSRLFGIISLEDDVQQALSKYNFSGTLSVSILTKRAVYTYSGALEHFDKYYSDTLTP